MAMASTAGISSLDLIDTSELDGKYLTFLMDGQLYGVPICDVVQITGMLEITAVPEFPYYAKGIVHLRGTVIPLIDARLRLGRPEAAYDDRTCIIDLVIGDRSVGLIVDQVDEVVSIPAENISAPPQMGGSSSGYVAGIGQFQDKLVLLLSSQTLVGGTALNF